MINRAIEWKLFSGPNPIKNVKMPIVRNQRERFLSFDEANLLLAELEKRDRDAHDMALISLQCGLRFGEIAALTGRDINFKGGTISIYDSKSGSRMAYMTDAVRDCLSRRMPEEPGSSLFTNSDGNRYKKAPECYRDVANRLFNVGIKEQRHRVSFHTLRHTFASLLALQGASLVVLRDLLGHKSLQMVSRYAHLSSDEKKKATLQLGKMFGERRAQVKTIRQ
jgi:integrase